MWPASHSQIYPELARLAADGLIRQTATGPRRRKVYELTAEGHRALVEWLRTTEPERTSRSEATLRVFFLWLVDAEAQVAALDVEEEAHRATLAAYEEMAAERWGDHPAERAGRVALEWGIRYERAWLEWLAWARAQLPLGPAEAAVHEPVTRARNGSSTA